MGLGSWLQLCLVSTHHYRWGWVVGFNNVLYQLITQGQIGSGLNIVLLLIVIQFHQRPLEQLFWISGVVSGVFLSPAM